MTRQTATEAVGWRNYKPVQLRTEPLLFQTISGRLIDPADLRAEDIDIEDIAYSLSRQARFLGHTQGAPISVAEHCMLVADLLARVACKSFELQLLGLLHDAAEAYLGDMPLPLKRLFPEYRFLSSRVQAVILAGLGLPEPTEEQALAIKWADVTALAAERDQCLAPGNDAAWAWLPGAPEPESLTVWRLPAGEAERKFLLYYHALLHCMERAA